MNTDRIAEPAFDQLPTRTMVRAIQIGTVLLMIGVGLLLNCWRLSSAADIDVVRLASEASYWGALTASLGVGMMRGVAVVYFYRLVYVLAKRNVETVKNLQIMLFREEL